MPTIEFVKKNKYGIAVVLIALTAFFYLKEDASRVSFDFLHGRLPQVASFLSCAENPLFEDSVLKVHKRPTDSIRLFIHFSERPSPDVRDFFASQGVVLHLDTWVLDYAVADTQVNRLCFLAGLPGITAISLGEL